MKITFIGTSSGKTSLQRFHSSILLSSSNNNLLVDSGDSISRALLSAEVNYNSIDGILFSHLHPDHYSGLAGLIVQMKMNNRKNNLHIYIHHSLVSVIQNYLINSYLLPERLGFEIYYIPFEDADSIIIDDQLSVKIFGNSHLAELEKSNLNSSLKIFSCSFLFESSDKKIFYTADIGSVNDILSTCPETVNILITEVTHINSDDLETIISKYDQAKVYFTHLTDEEEKLESLISKLPSERVYLPVIALDGMIIQA